MATLEEDLQAASQWISAALQASGYQADFSGASLREIDRFFDEQTKRGKGRPGGLLAEDLGGRIFAIGAYVGEVLRRSDDGWAWRVDEAGPQSEIDVTLEHVPTSGTTWPVQKVMKRFTNGGEDSLAAYGHVLGVDIGPAPIAPTTDSGRRRWFGRD